MIYLEVSYCTFISIIVIDRNNNANNNINNNKSKCLFAICNGFK